MSKNPVFGWLWSNLARSRFNFNLVARYYDNLLIEPVILVPNLIGLERKLYVRKWCAYIIYYYFEAIFRGWDEKISRLKPRTTEVPRTAEARTREALLYYGLRWSCRDAMIWRRFSLTGTFSGSSLKTILRIDLSHEAWIYVTWSSIGKNREMDIDVISCRML